MAFWLARERTGQDSDWIQRFDPRFWTVNHPRPMLAAATVTAPDALRIDATFLTTGDLAGVIWDSVDRFDHPLLAYDTDRDYTRTTLSFRWRASGVLPLDHGQGPTLTVEGRDASGTARVWYVRLWNYRTSGTGTDARIVLPFSSLFGGFSVDDRTNPVYPGAIDRLFISLVPPGYAAAGTGAPLAAPVEAWVELSELHCDGERAMLAIGDVLVPPHGLGCATAYDDQGHLTPSRVLRNVEGLGYRGTLLHYVGMNRALRIGAVGSGWSVDGPGAVLAAPARAWHSALLREAVAMGLSPQLSFSYEVLASWCPDNWQQRGFDGTAARTGWDPPSALLSPASPAAMAWLQRLARELTALQRAAGCPVRVQIGEPWWWIDATRRPCLYDPAARARLGGNPPEIADLARPLSADQCSLLDRAGTILAESTAALRDAIRAETAPHAAEVALLAFLPSLLDPAQPEVRRVNLPVAWAAPAFDRLQLEDYDWLTSGADGPRRLAYAAAIARLAYPQGQVDYLAGFAAGGGVVPWQRIDAGADEALQRGAGAVIVWALPQICRDGFVRLPPIGQEDDVQAFDDVAFPLALGRDAAVMPAFSTSVMVTASGHERRNSLWSDARLRFDLGPGIRSSEEMGVLIAFFRARRGAARGFRLRDPSDFSSNGMTGTPTATDQLLGLGDGLATSFALIKRYGSEDPQVRRITRPVAGSLKVSVNGAVSRDWTLAPGGIVTFTAAPPRGARVCAGFLFDVPVRFAEDSLAITGHGFGAGEVASIPVIELREAA